MPATAQQLHQCLSERLAPSALEVIDESALHHGHAGANAEGYGSHFRVRISCTHWADLPRVQRHRRVYEALQDFIDDGLHALAIEAQ